MEENQINPSAPLDTEIPEVTMATKVEQKETVLVDKRQLDEILSKIESLEDDNRKLNAISDKSRLEWYNKGKEKKGPNRFRVSTYDGKVVTSWRMVKDVVDKNIATGVYFEHQEYEIICEDGSRHLIVGYNKFADVQYAAQLEAEEIGRNTTDESTTLKLKLVDSGRELQIDIKYVN